MTRILFLDCDGVINSTRYLYAPDCPARTWDTSDPMRFALDMDPVLVALLNEVVCATGCKIVISSSWRHAHSPEQMEGYLRHRGFVGEVIGATDYCVRISEGTYGSRGCEIARWLDDNDGLGVEAFAIVDDGSDAGDGLEEHFVRTDLQVGLTVDSVRELIRILLEPTRT